MFMNYEKNKEAIGPVVAIALLIVVSVLAVVGFQSWYKSYSSDIYTNVELNKNDMKSVGEIENIIDEKLYIKVKDNLSIKKVLIENFDCNINQNLEKGIRNVDLSDCLDNINSNVVEVTLITENYVISKKIYLDEISEQILGPPPLNDEFITKWNTSIRPFITDTQISLPLDELGTYNFNVSWGDGTSDIITSYNQEEVFHNYSSPGVYTVTIYGILDGFTFSGVNDKSYNEDKIIDIVKWGDVKLSKYHQGAYFYDCMYLNISALDAPDLSEINSLAYMFNYAENFNGDINHWDVSNINNMEKMFYVASNFNQSLNSWDVGQVTNMLWMFNGASKFNGDISSWNVSQVTNMNGMFYGTSDFNIDIGSWDVVQVTNMGSMFKYSYDFNHDLTSWDVDQVNYCSDFINLQSGLESGNLPNFTNCSI